MLGNHRRTRSKKSMCHPWQGQSQDLWLIWGTLPLSVETSRVSHGIASEQLCQSQWIRNRAPSVSMEGEHSGAFDNPIDLTESAKQLSLVECFRAKDVSAVREWRECTQRTVAKEHGELSDGIEQKCLTEHTGWDAREWVHGKGRFNKEHKAIAHNLLTGAGLKVKGTDQAAHDEDDSDIEWATLVGMVSLMVDYLETSNCAYMMYIQQKVELIKDHATIMDDFKHDKLVLGYVYAMWTGLISGTDTPV